MQGDSSNNQATPEATSPSPNTVTTPQPMMVSPSNTPEPQPQQQQPQFEQQAPVYQPPGYSSPAMTPVTQQVPSATTFAPAVQPPSQQPPTPQADNSPAEVPQQPSEEPSFYRPEAPSNDYVQQFAQPSPVTATAPQEAVSWTASEYANNHKGAGWFAAVFLLSILVAAVTFLVSRSIFSTIAITLTGVALVVFGMNKPRVLPYTLTDRGLQVGQKLYPYSMFKSFALTDEGSYGTISLIPLKRFSWPITVHFSLDDGERIVGTMAGYLPLEEHKNDALERLSHRFRL